MTEIEKLSDKIVKKWLIYMCYLNDAYGISFNEIYEKKKKAITQDYGDLMKLMRELQKENFVEEYTVQGSLVSFYKTTKKGRDFIFKTSNTNELEFYKILSLAPSEYELKTRLKNLEKFGITGIFAFMIYSTALILSAEHLTWKLILIGLFFILVPFLIMGFMRVLNPYLVSFLERIYKKTAFALQTKSLWISRISTILLLIVAIIILWDKGNDAVRWTGIASIILGCILSNWLKNIQSWIDSINNSIKNIGEKM